MELEKLRKVYQAAQSDRTGILGKYNNIARHTMPYFSVWDENQQTVTKRNHKINATILQASKDLNNLIMSSMFEGGEWAKVKIDKQMFNDMLVDESESVSARMLEDFTKVLDTDSERVFKYIYNSNYSKAVSKALSECINLGTGCIKMVERASITSPMVYKHIPVSMMTFSEDILGRPSNTFINYQNITHDDYKELFGEEAPAETTGRKKFNVIEGVVRKEGEDEGFEQIITCDGFKTHGKRTDIPYNPFIVFRWTTGQQSAYGLGLGFDLIDEFEELEEHKELRKTSAKHNIFPAMAYFGPAEFMKGLTFGMGTFSYAGPSPQTTDVRPMNPTGNYIPLMEEIAENVNNIREAYISQPIGSYTDKSNVTATEIDIRVSMFRDRFAQTYELLSDELLKSTFMNAFRYLINKGVLGFDTEYVDTVDLQYINRMSKVADTEKANNIINFRRIGLELYPDESGIIQKSMSMLPKIGELMDVPRNEYLSEEEAKEAAKILQAMQSQQMGGMPSETQGSPGAGAITG